MKISEGSILRGTLLSMPLEYFRNSGGVAHGSIQITPSYIARIKYQGKARIALIHMTVFPPYHSKTKEALLTC
jgi:hypothetical protein